MSSDALFDAVRDAIENLHELPGLSDTRKFLFNRATLKIYDRPALKAVVQAIHGLDLTAHDGRDVKGASEDLLSKRSASGTNDQFRRPRHISDMIVALADPKTAERICRARLPQPLRACLAGCRLARYIQQRTAAISAAFVSARCPRGAPDKCGRCQDGAKIFRGLG